MCGFVGYFNWNNEFNFLELISANDLIDYRGMDDSGYLLIKSNYETVKSKSTSSNRINKNEKYLGGLGFRRLSIIDLSENGSQPFIDITGHYAIVFNGELYNYLEIRSELINKGYKFKSNSDTEVVLTAYIEWGKDALKKFRGMWAFCIYSNKDKLIFLSVDRLGIKPICYYYDGNSFVFASEIKQIRCLMGKKGTLNEKLIFDYLYFGSYCEYSNETMFSNIFKLKGGEYIEFSLENPTRSEIKINKWWELDHSYVNNELSEENIYNTLYEILQESYKLHMRSDLPVSLALSGGVDSSILAYLNKKLGFEKTKNFSVVSNELRNDDPIYLKIVLNDLKNDSVIINFENNLQLKDLEKCIDHQYVPIQSASILGGFKLYETIAKYGYKVAIDGQGIDELLCGYEIYPFRRYFSEIINNFELKEFLNQVQKTAKIHEKQAINLVIQSIVSYALFYKTPLQLHSLIKKIKINHYYKKSFIAEQLHLSTINIKPYLKKYARFNSPIQKESFDLLRYSNLPGILRQVDRNSMAHGVEARVPYLDHKLVEFLFALPSNYKIRNGYTKYSIRKAFERIVPKEVIWRKSKIGFTMPEEGLLRNNKENFLDNLNTLKNTEYFNKKYIEESFMKYYNLEQKYNSNLWRIFTFMIWDKQVN